MRAGLVVVGRIFREDSTQVRGTEDRDVVEDFAPDRPDQSLGVRILPWRSWLGRMIALRRLRKTTP